MIIEAAKPPSTSWVFSRGPIVAPGTQQPHGLTKDIKPQIKPNVFMEKLFTNSLPMDNACFHADLYDDSQNHCLFFWFLTTSYY